MNLSQKSDRLDRRLTWRDKTLANCSKGELIECVAFLSQQLAIQNARLQEQMRQLGARVEPSVPRPTAEQVVNAMRVAEKPQQLPQPVNIQQASEKIPVIDTDEVVVIDPGDTGRCPVCGDAGPLLETCPKCGVHYL